METTLVTFRVENSRIAFPVNLVQRVIWALRITPVPGQNRKFKGVINVEEEVIPIIDLRHILGMRECDLEVDDDIVIVDTSFGQLGMIADRVEGVEHYLESQLSPAGEQLESLASSVLRLDDGLVVIIDPSKLISEDDLPALRKLVAAKGVKS
jgi:purine-binding chemotaxis protein CheW